MNGSAPKPGASIGEVRRGEDARPDCDGDILRAAEPLADRASIGGRLCALNAGALKAHPRGEDTAYIAANVQAEQHAGLSKARARDAARPIRAVFGYGLAHHQVVPEAGQSRASARDDRAARPAAAVQVSISVWRRRIAHPAGAARSRAGRVRRTRSIRGARRSRAAEHGEPHQQVAPGRPL